jgi:hypothetical protein
LAPYRSTTVFHIALNAPVSVTRPPEDARPSSQNERMTFMPRAVAESMTPT